MVHYQIIIGVDSFDIGLYFPVKRPRFIYINQSSRYSEQRKIQRGDFLQAMNMHLPMLLFVMFASERKSLLHDIDWTHTSFSP